jgi:hypothetical protein
MHTRIPGSLLDIQDRVFWTFLLFTYCIISHGERSGEAQNGGLHGKEGSRKGKEISCKESGRKD